ncbi:MAG: hypothetical protein U0105_10025 [Candidatus Obscuribacterales bacterium]
MPSPLPLISLQDLLSKGAELSETRAPLIEGEVRDDAAAADKRIMLLGHYMRGYNKKDTRERAAKLRAPHIFWFIRQEPGHLVLDWPEGQFSFDDPNYPQAKRMLLKQTETHPQDVRIMRNTVSSVMFADPQLAQELLKKIRQIEPDNAYWLNQLLLVHQLQCKSLQDIDLQKGSADALIVAEQMLRQLKGEFTDCKALLATSVIADFADQKAKADDYHQHLQDLTTHGASEDLQKIAAEYEKKLTEVRVTGREKYMNRSPEKLGEMISMLVDFSNSSQKFKRFDRHMS